MRKIKLCLALIVSLVLLSGCSPWNSSGQTIDNEGNAISGQDPLPVSAIIQGTDSNGNAVTLSADSATRGLETISTEHVKLHLGDMFSLYDVVDIPNSGNQTLSIFTPNLNQNVHIVFDIETESEAEWELYEDSVVSANGTVLTAYNRNRNSSSTASTIATRTPTITTLGTLIAWRHWGSGKGVGGGERASDEWMLKSNTRYIIRITNFTTNANHSSLKMTWYKQSP